MVYRLEFETFPTLPVFEVALHSKIRNVFYLQFRNSIILVRFFLTPRKVETDRDIYYRTRTTITKFV